MEWWQELLMVVVCLVLGYAAHSIWNRMKMNAALRSAQIILDDAERKADLMKKEAELQGRAEVLRAREAFEGDIKLRRQELMTVEERTTLRESNLDRKVAMLDKKEQLVDQKLEDIEKQKVLLQLRDHELNTLGHEQRNKLLQISAMSQEEARKEFMRKLEGELRFEAGALIRHIQEDTKAEAEEKARELITLAIERYAADQVNEVTTSSVALPNDEMKGRIIGREGRNIRSLEAVTGVNILIDDTPETVVISGFDPLRREVARLALERLMADGRIHPARIEEVVAKVQEDLTETIKAVGEAAIYEVGLQGVAPEIMQTVGELKYRHSYSQNVLQHSIEMAHLMGMMAAELNLDPVIAKRVGLFHDIGKAMDHKIEGGHALIGAEYLKRYGEAQVVYNAVASHHKEAQGESIYAVLATAADAMTAARPGARSESTELYLKRLEKLEQIANDFRGVQKCFAMQAGREIRVIVEPGKIDDNEALQMARNISQRIEHELKFPGQIKVTVIRELRCVEYAK